MLNSAVTTLSCIQLILVFLREGIGVVSFIYTADPPTEENVKVATFTDDTIAQDKNAKAAVAVL